MEPTHTHTRHSPAELVWFLADNEFERKKKIAHLRGFKFWVGWLVRKSPEIAFLEFLSVLVSLSEHRSSLHRLQRMSVDSAVAVTVGDEVKEYQFKLIFVGDPTVGRNGVCGKCEGCCMFVFFVIASLHLL